MLASPTVSPAPPQYSTGLIGLPCGEATETNSRPSSWLTPFITGTRLNCPDPKASRSCRGSTPAPYTGDHTSALAGRNPGTLVLSSFTGLTTRRQARSVTWQPTSLT